MANPLYQITPSRWTRTSIECKSEEEAKPLIHTAEIIHASAKQTFEASGQSFHLGAFNLYLMAKRTSKWILDKTGEETFSDMHVKIFLCNPRSKVILCEWIHLANKDAFVISQFSLGSGGQSKVLSGVSIHGAPLAVLKNENGQGYSLQEIKMLKSLRNSSHVIHLFDGNSEYLIEQYAPHCLFNLTKNPSKYSQFDTPERRYSITKGIIQGLADIHAQGIIHSDMKLENILLTEEGTALIADFGLSVWADPGMVHAGSLGYYSPEQIESVKSYVATKSLHKLSTQVDIWQTMTALTRYHLPRLSPAYQDRFKEYQYEVEKIYDGAMTEAERHASCASPSDEERVKMRKWTELYSERLASYFNDKKSERSGLFSDLPRSSPLEKILNQMGQFDPVNRPEAADILKMLDRATPEHFTASYSHP